MELSRGHWPSKLHEIMNEESDDNWSATVERIRTHPEEVRIVGERHNQTALHGACFRYPPLVAIRAFVNCFPEAARIQNKEGETPLHLAIEGASEEVQKFLVEAAPETVSMVDQYGDSPLHMAARAGATYDVLQKFCQASPQTVSLPNNRGKTPFWLLPRSYLRAASMAEVEQEGGDYENDWKCSMLFLNSTISPGSQFHLAHAAAAAPSCPRDLLSFICRICSPPNEATRYNAQGKTPLLLATAAHVVAEPVEWDEEEDGFREEVDPNENWYDSDDEESQAAADANVALHNFANTINLEQIVEGLAADSESPSTQDSNAPTSRSSVVNVLVKWNPRAASMADSDGRLPLAHAICTDKTWKDGIQQLLLAAPRALETRDMQTHLYPFQVAAAYSTDLDTIYCLTRALPELVAMGIPYDETTAEVKGITQATNVLHKTEIKEDKKSDISSSESTENQKDAPETKVSQMKRFPITKGYPQLSHKRQRTCS